MQASLFIWIPKLLTISMGIAYGVLATRQQANRGWNRWRTALFMTGCICLLAGFSPRLSPYAVADFRTHMLGHLFVAMIAPIALVMAAPMTLVLRSLPARYGRVVTAILRNPLARLLAHPLVALTLDLGGMALLYFTPLYVETMRHPGLHCLVQFHLVIAGCLYAWVIAGPDPAPHRPSVPARLVLLGAAVVVHSVLSQLLYAGWHVAIPVAAAQLQGGAEWMYYGGDIAEMLLAFALVSSWQPVRTPARAAQSSAFVPVHHG